MESELTLIRDGQLFYRGQNALELANHAPPEKSLGSSGRASCRR